MISSRQSCKADCATLRSCLNMVLHIAYGTAPGGLPVGGFALSVGGGGGGFLFTAGSLPKKRPHPSVMPTPAMRMMVRAFIRAAGVALPASAAEGCG